VSPVTPAPPGPQPVPDLHLAPGTSTTDLPPVPPVPTGDPGVTAGPRDTGPDRSPVVVRPDGRGREAARTVVLLAVVLAASVALGSVVAAPGRTLVHNRMLPWILGRSLGLAAYLALTGAVVLGLWLRHPWRARLARPSPTSVLWAHVTLVAGTVTLLLGHVTALALDQYAGVGWIGVFVPWGARYRPTPTALGALALYSLVLVAGTAALAGSIGRRIWFPVHTVSVLVFCLVLAHGVLTGSDARALQWLYVGTGVAVLVLQVTRWFAGRAGRTVAGMVE